MATALFQCIDNGTAIITHSYLLRQFSNVQHFDNLVAVVFDGDCGEVYWRCMRYAEGTDNKVAFIGIDETASYPSDPYEVFLLGSMPQYKSYRTDGQTYAFARLVEQFMNAVTSFELTEDQIEEICKQCVLGEDPDGSAFYCMNAVRVCGTQGRQCNYKNVLDSAHAWTYSCPTQNTMVRVMAHICYLGNAARTQRRGLFDRLFGGR